MQNFICEGCQADLSRGRQIPIHVIYGVFHLACPVCKYEMKVTVDAEGNLHLVNQKEVT